MNLCEYLPQRLLYLNGFLRVRRDSYAFGMFTNWVKLNNNLVRSLRNRMTKGSGASLYYAPTIVGYVCYDIIVTNM